jgi:Leucine-rich repeat (LRR) protein
LRERGSPTRALAKQSLLLPTRPCPKEEQLGAATFASIRALDLSSLRIRDTGVVFAPAPPPASPPFGGLVELTLDGNQLGPGALPALAGLTGLAVLRLNDNRMAERGDSGSGSSAICSGRSSGSGTEGRASGWGDAAAPADAAAGGVAPPPPAPCGGPPAGPAGWRLPGLQVLELRGNALNALTPLQLAVRAPGLRRLDMAGNELARVDGLEGLARLRELVVSRNKLRCGAGKTGPGAGLMLT